MAGWMDGNVSILVLKLSFIVVDIIDEYLNQSRPLKNQLQDIDYYIIDN